MWRRRRGGGFINLWQVSGRQGLKRMSPQSLDEVRCPLPFSMCYSHVLLVHHPHPVPALEYAVPTHALQLVACQQSETLQSKPEQVAV